MNIAKSVNVALAMHEKKKAWLADRMGISVDTLYRRISVNNPTSDSIQQFANAFEMKASEFVALGE